MRGVPPLVKQDPWLPAVGPVKSPRTGEFVLPSRSWRPSRRSLDRLVIVQRWRGRAARSFKSLLVLCGMRTETAEIALDWIEPRSAISIGPPNCEPGAGSRKKPTLADWGGRSWSERETKKPPKRPGKGVLNGFQIVPAPTEGLPTARLRFFIEVADLTAPKGSSVPQRIAALLPRLAGRYAARSNSSTEATSSNANSSGVANSIVSRSVTRTVSPAAHC